MNNIILFLCSILIVCVMYIIYLLCNITTILNIYLERMKLTKFNEKLCLNYLEQINLKADTTMLMFHNKHSQDRKG